ncbi:MAG: helicase HerA-like domain-containing protein [Sulfurifustis sp.]
MNETIYLGKSKREVSLLPRMANRHGLIAGATGTGKTVTLQVLAEGFSRLGVPVFLADVKGDLSGVSQPGRRDPKLEERIKKVGVSGYTPRGYPVCYWDVYGALGHPARTTISEMGPLLLGRLLNLNETQAGVLTALFKLADDNGWLLLDLKDLRALTQFAGDNARSLTTEYGNISVASVGAIQRALLALESQGGTHLFGEPALNLDDLMQTADDGRGVINVLVAEKLMQSPKVYATLLLWLLADLYERLPEVGDRDKPKLVFFFDEAHLLFTDAPAPLLERIEQVVRLIRSKGVGVYFITQNPLDVPEVVLGQLGNRVQHALRAFTPKDQKAVKAAAETFRANASFKTADVISELAVGEALVSVLDEKGAPTPVERILIAPPESRIGPVTPEERDAVIRRSPLYGHYEKSVDRESAYEILKRRAEPAAKTAPPTAAGSVLDVLLGGDGKSRRSREGVVEAMTKSAARAIGSQIGRQIIRGVLGSLLGGRR